MEKIIKYKCSICGDLFNSGEECIKHEERHERINTANEMLEAGCTLQEIQETCHIWYSVPEHLKEVNKDNCFTISYWQCCDKPAYQICYIYMDGRVKVWGCGSWDGYYGNTLGLDSRNLKDVHSKEELFIDSRYKNKW